MTTTTPTQATLPAKKTHNPNNGGTQAYLATEHYNEGWNDCVDALGAADACNIFAASEARDVGVSDADWLALYEKVKDETPNIFGSYMKMAGNFARAVLATRASKADLDRVLPGEFTDAESLIKAMNLPEAAPVAVGDASWQEAFNKRHEFDVYPDHFMAAMRNEFSAGWYAALTSQAAPKPNGYAYLYPYGSNKTIVQFTDGESCWGHDPIAAVPYYFGEPVDVVTKLPIAAQPDAAKGESA